MVEPVIWFGRPGRLVPLLPPLPDVESVRDRPTAVATTIGGGRSVDVRGTGRRTWRYAWRGLTLDEHALVDSFHAGARGIGPWVLLDPALPNLAYPNQAAGTDVSADTTGFWTHPSNVLASSTLHFFGGRRSLRWQIPAPVVSPGFRLVTPWPAMADGLWGYPIPTGATLAASTMVYSEQPVTVGWFLRWHNQAGTVIGDLIRSPRPPATPDWTPRVTVGTAPPDAVYVSLATYIDPESVAVPTDIWLDHIQLTLVPAGTTEVQPPAWTPGAGVPMVSITSWTTTSPYHGVYNADLTLTEVG